MRIFAYIIYLLIIGMFVVIWRDLTSISIAVINLPALIVLLVGLYKDDVEAAWFGFFAGLVAAANMSNEMGWYSLILAVLAMASCHMRERINLDSLRAKVLMIGGGLLVHNIIVTIAFSPHSFWYDLVTVVPAGAAYTTVLAWLFFLFKEGQITFARIRSIF